MKTDYAGLCGTCQRTWNIGDELFLSKSADGSRWIKCTDKDCFTKQGGKIEDSGGKGGKFQSTKFKIGEADNLYNKAKSMMEQFIKDNVKEGEVKLDTNQKAIMMESLFRTLSSNYKP